MFFNVFLHLHTHDAWWTVNEVAVVGTDISGVLQADVLQVCLVRSEVSLLSISSALHSWMASSSAETENLFCFLLMVPASHLCHVFDLPCCCSVSGKIRNYYWSLIKNAWHSLFYVAREISRQFYQLCAHFLLHEWPRSVLTLVEIDRSWICIYTAARFNHIILYLWDGCIFMRSCVSLNRYSGTFKWKNSEKAAEDSLVFIQTVLVL